MIDTNKRSFLKSISWRIIGITVLGTVSFLLTGSVKSAGLITIIHNVIQIIFYFLHEKIWKYIPWWRSKGLFVQLTGLSGAGKTTLSRLVAQKLKKNGYLCEIIDGDEYRENITKGLGFSKADRLENIRRLGFIGRVLARNNVIAILAAINPYEEAREELTKMGARTVWVKAPLSVLTKRDPKGLYQKAMLPDGHPDKILNFTGISDEFQEPKNVDLVIDTSRCSVEEAANKLYKFILDNSK